MLLTTDIVSTPLVLSAVYSALLIYISISLSRIQPAQHASTNLRSLFTQSCLAAALLRVISFASLGIINAFSRRDDTSTLSQNAPLFSFFEKALLVLFDLPDFCTITAYLLLLLKWMNVFINSRMHWLNSLAYKKHFVGAYIALNISLYAVQMTLYSLLFAPSVNQESLATAIYYTLAGINFALPLLWLVTFIVLSLQFSGFPYNSPEASRIYKQVSRVCEIWTASRLSWAALSLTTVLEGWMQIDKTSHVSKALTLAAVFIFLEIVPVVVAIHAMQIPPHHESSLRAASVGRSMFSSAIRGVQLEDEDDIELNRYVASASGNPVDNEIYLQLLGEVTSPLAADSKRRDLPVSANRSLRSPRKSFMGTPLKKSPVFKLNYS